MSSDFTTQTTEIIGDFLIIFDLQIYQFLDNLDSVSGLYSDLSRNLETLFLELA